MRRILEFAEYRFFVPGKAISFRTKNAKKYKKLVKKFAMKVFKRKLIGNKLQIIIDYFYKGSRKFDMDNIEKCIIDALTGVAYNDDLQIFSTTVNSYPIDQITKLSDVVIDIVKPLRWHDTYTFIRLRNRTDLEFRKKGVSGSDLTFDKRRGL